MWHKDDAEMDCKVISLKYILLIKQEELRLW